MEHGRNKAPHTLKSLPAGQLHPATVFLRKIEEKQLCAITRLPFMSNY
jgi:hypothetical protein